jgi:UDP-N-acetylglucosamine--N-acetylmuramyl-(pentapeptide) pyrophosphoryl-undecaprenol N-acetylglucosamine transferase
MADSTQQKLIVLATGGTGGHVFPAEALAEVLLAGGHRVVLITDKRFANFTTGALSRVETRTIRTGTVFGSLFNKMSGVAGLLSGMAQVFFLLKNLKPDVVVGFGGYPSFPTLFVAPRIGVPTLIHEQNSVLGRANRLLAGKVDAIATSFPGTLMMEEKDKAKITVTGNPVRASVKALRNVPYSGLQQDGKFNILVTGGSQGATIFSEVVPEAIAALPANLRARIRVDQQCREADVEATRAAYARMNINADIASFFVDLPTRLAGAHLVIARSGASTIFELAVAGRPAILVPLPTSMDNHQYYNANAFEDVGGGWLMNQNGFTAASLSARLEAFLTAPDSLVKAAENAKKLGYENAAENCAALVLSLARGVKK